MDCYVGLLCEFVLFGSDNMKVMMSQKAIVKTQIPKKAIVKIPNPQHHIVKTIYNWMACYVGILCELYCA